MRPRLALLLSTALLAGILPDPAAHALMVRRSLAERTQDAEAVVVGTVVAQESRWDPADALIFTDVTLQVSETLKSPGSQGLPARVVIRVAGGRVGRFYMRVSDVPEFQPQEQVIVCLRRATARGVYHVVDGTQGTFRLITDPASGQLVVVNPEGAFLMDTATERFLRSPVQQAPVTFSAFRRHLQELIGETAR